MKTEEYTIWCKITDNINLHTRFECDPPPENEGNWNLATLIIKMPERKKEFTESGIREACVDLGWLESSAEMLNDKLFDE